MVPEQLYSHMQKNECGPVPHILYENELGMKTRPTFNSGNLQNSQKKTEEQSFVTSGSEWFLIDDTKSTVYESEDRSAGLQQNQTCFAVHYTTKK